MPVKKDKRVTKVLEAEIVDDNSREAPKQRSIVPVEIVQPSLNKAQLAIVTGNTPKWAIKVRQGRGGKAFRYVSHGYVTDTLNKAFGFDWDLIIDPMADGKMYALEIERIPILDKNGKQVDETVVRHIAVAGKLVVRVHNGKEVVATITKAGFGSQLWLPSMEFGDALKAARSDLIKTCAFQLGIALDLYWNENAEQDSYVAKVEKQAAATKVAEAMSSSASPKTFLQLISKAMADYGLEAEQVAEIAGLENGTDDLMVMNADSINKVWEMVVKHATKK